MPSTQGTEAQSTSRDEKDFNNQNESEFTDTRSSRESPPNKAVRSFGLSNKIKKETKKLLGYPGKAMKRSANWDVQLADSENKNSDTIVHQDFSRYFKEHDILMEL